MRILTILSVLLLSLNVTAADRSLNQKITHLEELERKVSNECLNNSNSSNVKVSVDNKTYSCPQLLVITKRIHTEIDKEIQTLESCEASETPAGDLAVSALAAAKKAGSCEVKSRDSQCMGEFGCTMLAAVNPLGALIGSRLSGEQNTCLAKGLSSAGNCLANVMKGIFDSLWGLLSLIWDVGTATIRSAGEWLGIIEKNERVSSEKLMAAQQAGPGFIKRFVANPMETMKSMASAMYNGIRDAAQESYGCEQWSGAPFVSRCLKPMTNWNCASCQQKLQVMCGVAGFAIGEIPTAILTGGIAAGAKAIALGTLKAIKVGAQASKVNTVAVAAIRAIPKSAEGLDAASRAATALAKGSGRVLTAAEKQALKAWKAIEESAASKAVLAAAEKVSASAAGDVTRIALKPAAVYLDALESGFKAGFSTVDNAVARSAAPSALVVETASAASKADRSAQYQRMSSLTPDQRVSEANNVLGRQLSQTERDAVLRAHDVGLAEGRGFGTYTDEDKYRKGSILIRSGLSRDEAQKLLDEGIAGAMGSATPAQYLRMQTQNSTIWADSKAEGIGKSWMSAETAAANTAEALKSYENAAKGYLQIARSADGKVSDYVKAAENFAKAGKNKEALEFIDLAMKKAGPNSPIKADLEASLKKILELREGESKNPLYAAHEESIRALIARLDKPAEVRPVVAATPAKPVEPPKPQVASKPAVTPAPAVPPVLDPSKVAPREASYIANEYRLGTNKRPKDPSLASVYYKRASEDHFKSQVRTAVAQRDTKFFDDRNLYSAFSESLAGDGKVAMEMIEELGKHQSSQPLNAFIWEMQEGNHYAQKTKVTRENMRKIIDKIQSEYKNRLFDPQRNGVRGWDSYNLPME